MNSVRQKTWRKSSPWESVITSAVQIPGVKVNRNKFLSETFASEPVPIQDILDLGPVEAKVPQEKLAALAGRLILKRTSQSSLASFATGIPGGLAMAATIPADVLQFFGMTLRLAQELSYLYGADDLWREGQIDDEKVRNQLLLYCGVMFGVSGAVSGVRVLSTQIAKTTLRKLPQKALTKTFWYPMVKQIGKVIGLKVTKSSVAKGVSKVVPVIGGIVSGGLNFASMMPMANKLQAALDSSVFGYTEEAFQQDLSKIENLSEDGLSRSTDDVDIKAKAVAKGKKLTENLTGLFGRKKNEAAAGREENVFAALRKLAELKEAGILTQEEFDGKKAELLSKIS